MRFKFIMYFMLISAAASAQAILEPPALLADSSQEFLMPKISPDGSKVAFGGSSFNSVFVCNYDGTGLSMITDKAASGYNIKWSPDSDALAVRANFWDNTMRNKTSSILVYDLEGRETNISGQHNNVSFPFWSSKGGSLSWIQNDSSISSFSILDTANDHTDIIRSNQLIRVAENQRSFEVKPVEGEYIFVDWSPNNSRAAIHVLGKGIYVYDTETRQVYDFGTGEYPSWINDNLLTLMVVKDDGHEITGSDIYLFNFSGKMIENLTAHFDPPALYASANREGKIVFQSGSGDIYKMKVSLSNPPRINDRIKKID